MRRSMLALSIKFGGQDSDGERKVYMPMKNTPSDLDIDCCTAELKAHVQAGEAILNAAP